MNNQARMRWRPAMGPATLFSIILLAGMLGTGAAQQRRTAPRQRPARPVPTAEQVQKRLPPGVKFVPDIAYREGNKAWRLDLYGGDKRSVLFLNGGIEYASSGYVAISVNYRLSGEAPFPACVEDVKCAVRWFRANASKYNVDPQRIGGYGNSAGAHLVAMLGLVGKEAGLEGDGPYQEQSSLLNAVCPSATPTDFLHWRDDQPMRPRPGTSGGLLAGPEDTFLERARRASPITYVRADAPPFLLFHGNADRTVPVSQSTRFVKALREAGAKQVALFIVDGEGHGAFTAGAPMTVAARKAFFDSTIGPKAKGSR